MFVAPADGKPIGEQAQADVAAEMADMKDVVVVRFLDVRDDAVQTDVEGEPVKDDGVLLLVGPVEEGPPPLELQVGVYHNADDEHTFTMKISKARNGDQQFDATSVSEIDQG
jgi:hypothetical protein